MYTLVKFSANYADEHEVDGFRIFEIEEWNRVIIKLERFFNDNGWLTWYFGSNQLIEWNTYDRFLETLTVRDIGETEKLVLTTLLGTMYGAFPTPNDIFDGWEEESASADDTADDEEFKEILEEEAKDYNS